MRDLNRNYTEDFKDLIIEVYYTGKPVKEISSEYGVSIASIYYWVNRKKKKSKVKNNDLETIKSSPSTINDTDEVYRLKKEIQRIQLENEILKKAIAIVTKENNQ